MREVIADAAFELFLERGFERTTVDDIVARAGVGRRSFFRYFPSKEDAVFPDHERCLAEMTVFLEGQAEGDPLVAVCQAARNVLRMYAAKPEFSVQRYRLTRDVPGLRTYELSVVRRYERTLAGYLRGRYAGTPDGALRAEVVAASVVAAHNNGLRSWLRSGGEGDAEAAVDRALALVIETWSGTDRPPVAGLRAGEGAGAVTDATGEGSRAGSGSGVADEEVVVVVAPRKAPLWQVVRQVRSALDAD
ncbi:TetR family transcriptional regulator [Streptomyces sp. AJS327]|uniref:TetR family transcriptional regulator n=1 Tax=Streptomyces sp. AJS327 TaxID=2545265 RepID=UPI0015DD80FF|nr:TetR family transcriptional regulator [Streptomyces sp. AJS327]MBA0052393.1 TetR family transcriptional regulator [Streptomyces sp. AJS327]